MCGSSSMDSQIRFVKAGGKPLYNSLLEIIRVGFSLTKPTLVLELLHTIFCKKYLVDTRKKWPAYLASVCYEKNWYLYSFIQIPWTAFLLASANQTLLLEFLLSGCKNPDSGTRNANVHTAVHIHCEFLILIWARHQLSPFSPKGLLVHGPNGWPTKLESLSCYIRIHPCCKNGSCEIIQRLFETFGRQKSCMIE